MSIGKNVKALRARKGLTQSQLAQASGMQLTQVSRIENNDTDPKASTLLKLMNALQCTANEIFDEPAESKKVTLEEFIGSVDAYSASHIDAKMAMVLWKNIDNHIQFLSAIEKAYTGAREIREDVFRKAFAQQGADYDEEVRKLSE